MIDEFLAMLTKEKTACIKCKYTRDCDGRNGCRIEEAVKTIKDFKPNYYTSDVEGIKVDLEYDNIALFNINPNKMYHTDIGKYKFTLGELLTYLIQHKKFCELMLIVQRPKTIEVYKVCRDPFPRIIRIGDGLGYCTGYGDN